MGKPFAVGFHKGRQVIQAITGGLQYGLFQLVPLVFQEIQLGGISLLGPFSGHGPGGIGEVDHGNVFASGNL